MSTTQNHHQPHISISSPAEILACAVHNVGYWPEKSVILMTASGSRMGPVLRVNVPSLDLDETEIEELIKGLLATTPHKLSTIEPITSFFLLIFSADTGLRSRQLNQHTHLQPEQGQIESESSQAVSYLPWIRGAMKAFDSTGFALGDILYIGEVSRWELREDIPSFKFSGFVEDVLKTDIYLSLLAEGSSVASRRSEFVPRGSFSPQATRERKLQQSWVELSTFWFDQCQSHIEADSFYLANYPQQKFAESKLWSFAIDLVQQELKKPLRGAEKKYRDAVVADRLRALIPEQVAGYLAATLTSTSSTQLVLFTAAESFKASGRLLATLNRVHPDLDLQLQPAPFNALFLPTALMGSGPFEEKAKEIMQENMRLEPEETDDEAGERFAELMTGQTVRGPEWERIIALEHLAGLLTTCCFGPEYGRIKLILAWIAWLKGSCSMADQILDETKELGLWEETPLDLVVECDLLPLWVSDGEQCFRSYFSEDFVLNP